MKIENAKAIANVLEVDPRWLIFGEGDPDAATSIADKIERLSEQQRELISKLIDEMPKTGTHG